MTASSSFDERGFDERGLEPSRPQTLILGVDGGGTKTLAWLANVCEKGEPKVIGRGAAGTSNKVAAGQETAFGNLKRAIDHAFADAQLQPSSVTRAVFALAGSGTTHARQQIQDFVSSTYEVESLSVIHDGQAVLQAGTPDGRGISLIAGTGAVAYGESPTGESAVVGGWGYWFGDEGSAYWLGQSALRAISQAADGRTSSTALTNAVLQQIGIEEPREILNQLSSSGETRLAIAGLAELVCDVAQHGDKIAGEIIATAAQHWSRHIACLAEQLYQDNPFPLAVAGGVLCGSSFAREQFVLQLSTDRLAPTSVEFVAEPVLGCLKLAVRQITQQIKRAD